MKRECIFRSMIVGGLSVFLVAACTDVDSESVSAVDNDSGAGAPKVKANAGVVPAHAMKALDRAKNTEAILMEADEKRRKQLGIN